MSKPKKVKEFDDSLYVVKAKVFGGDEQPISVPLDKLSADALADNLKAAMNNIETDYKAFSNIKVVKNGDDEYEMDIVKNDPYGYSVLDDLDRKIKDGKEFKIKDESGKTEKVKTVKFKTK